MKTTHLGSGIVLFENIPHLNHAETSRFLNNLTLFAKADSYAESNDNLKNSGGYEFEKEQIKSTPLRYQNLRNQNLMSEDLSYVGIFDDVLIRCLVEYCRIFPTAIETVRWKTDGYIIRYLPNQYIGPHSDCAIPYDSSTGEALSEFPLYNTITSSIILNGDYEGGAVYFRQWGISITPKPNSVLMYSSSYLGCHEVSAIKSGERFAYLSWFGHGNLGNEQNYRKITQELEQIPRNERYPRTVLVGEVK